MKDIKNKQKKHTKAERGWYGEGEMQLLTIQEFGKVLRKFLSFEGLLSTGR